MRFHNNCDPALIAQILLSSHVVFSNPWESAWLSLVLDVCISLTDTCLSHLCHLALNTLSRVCVLKALPTVSRGASSERHLGPTVS